MRLIAWFVIISITTVLLSACGGKNNKEDKISTDVIQNPNSASGDVNSDKLPKITFEETEHDFGKVIEGEIVTYAYKFKNTGGSDLIISSVSTSCGCTASEYPKQPLKPGQEGVVKLTFNSNRRKGFQDKSATVLANTQPNRTKLRIKAMVINPEKDNL